MYINKILFCGVWRVKCAVGQRHYLNHLHSHTLFRRTYGVNNIVVCHSGLTSFLSALSTRGHGHELTTPMDDSPSFHGSDDRWIPGTGGRPVISPSFCRRNYTPPEKGPTNVCNPNAGFRLNEMPPYTIRPATVGRAPQLKSPVSRRNLTSRNSIPLMNKTRRLSAAISRVKRQVRGRKVDLCVHVC